MAAHAWWRLRFLGRSSATGTYTIASIGFAAEPWGADEATGGTPIASSGTALNAFHGTAGNWVAGDATADHWLGYHYTSPVEVTWAMITIGTVTGGAPMSMVLQWSDDGTTWTDYGIVVGLSNWFANESRDVTFVPPTGASDPHSYWRLHITANYAGAFFPGLGELIFSGTPGGPQLATSGTAIASSGTAANAFNGNTTTGWAAGATNHATIGYQFASPVSIQEWTVQSLAAGNVTSHPMFGVLQWSNDNSNWESVAWEYYPSWSNGVSRSKTNYAYVAPAPDPSFSNVVLLLHGDGANASTTFTDSAYNPATFTAAGGAVITTAQAKFGGASMDFSPARAAVISAPDNAKWTLGTNQFTIEAWVRYTGDPTAQTANTNPTIISHWNGNTAGTWGWNLRHNTSGNLVFNYTTDGSTLLFVGGVFAPTLNQWYHIAVERDAANTLRLFVDGAVLASASSFTADIFNSTETLRVGGEGITTRGWVGQIDEVRITKGTYRYGAAFTPPTAPFPAGVVVNTKKKRRVTVMA